MKAFSETNTYSHATADQFFDKGEVLVLTETSRYDTAVLVRLLRPRGTWLTAPFHLYSFDQDLDPEESSKCHFIFVRWLNSENLSTKQDVASSSPLNQVPIKK